MANRPLLCLYGPQENNLFIWIGCRNTDTHATGLTHPAGYCDSPLQLLKNLVDFSLTSGHIFTSTSSPENMLAWIFISASFHRILIILLDWDIATRRGIHVILIKCMYTMHGCNILVLLGQQTITWLKETHSEFSEGGRFPHTTSMCHATRMRFYVTCSQNYLI